MVASAPTRPRARRLKPIAIGPTWQRARGGWVLPRWTLGWDALEWASAYLRQPDGPNAGSEWRFTDEQARFLLHFYAIDARGDFIYRSAVLRRMKGWGKDPFGAALCAIEFVGPCRFGGWNEQHEPIVIPNPSSWVQTAGVAQEQTKNTTILFQSLFSKKARDEYGISLGKTLIYAHGSSCRIEAVTTAADTAEGNRPSFVLANETQHWLATNEGHAMAEAFRRNIAKGGGPARILAITNAHAPGQDSVAEQDYEAYLAISSGASRATGFLYDSLEAPPETDLADDKSLRAGLTVAAGDSYWVNPDRLIEEIHDPRTKPSDSRRFYLNQIHAAEDAWLSPQEWIACARPSHKVPAQALVTLGLSGRKVDDSTALMACEVETGHVFTLGVWEAPEKGEVARAAVDVAVAAAFEAYDVVGFYARLDPFQAWVEDWERGYSDLLCARVAERHPVAVDERARQAWRTKATEAFHDAVVTAALTQDAHPVVTQHVINARRRPMTQGIDIDKESRTSTHLVDAARAAVFARQARQDYLALPEKRQRKVESDVQVY